MDRSQNRQAMPKANYDAWPKIEVVAATILFLARPRIAPHVARWCQFTVGRRAASSAQGSDCITNPRGKLYVDPALPVCLPDMTLTDLRLGRRRFDIRFWRKGKDTSSRCYWEA